MREDVIILDDDELVCDFWEQTFRRSRRSIRTFRCQKEFFRHAPHIRKSSTLFIDKNLEGKAFGVEITKKLFLEGFKNLYLSTAEPLKSQPKLSWIKGVVGKTPPDWLFYDIITAPLSRQERQNLLDTMSEAEKHQYRQRMEHFLSVVHGQDSGAFAGPDLNGFNLPSRVMNAWERAITQSLTDHQIKVATDHAWNCSLGSD